MVGGDWRTAQGRSAVYASFTLLWILRWFRGYSWALELGGSDSGRVGLMG